MAKTGKCCIVSHCDSCTGWDAGHYIQKDSYGRAVEAGFSVKAEKWAG